MTLLERAAFGDRPDLRNPAPANDRERWLAAVVLGGQGRYAAAATYLEPLRQHSDAELAALAAATHASHRRQLGGHAAARVIDAAGLRRLAAAGRYPDAREATADLLLGLAADAIGSGALAEARRLRAAAPRDTWRADVRAGWVSAEIELGAGRADLALPHAEAAADRAAGSGSTRHRIKSDLVLGAALGPSDRAMARKLVTRARDDATDLDLLSLVWPAALILADLDPSEATAHCRCAALALHGVLRRADPRGRGLAERSPWVPTPTGPTG